MAIRSTESTEAASSGTDQKRRKPGLVTRVSSQRHVTGTGGSPLRWFFSAVWLIYLIQPVADLFGRQHGVLYIAGGLLVAAAFCAIYLLVLMYLDEHPRLVRSGLEAIAVLAALACVVYGKEWTPLWIYVSAAAGMVLAPAGRRVALPGILAVGACYAFFAWLSHFGLGNFLGVLLPVLLVGVAMMGFRWQITLMHDLAEARETVAKLAVNEERLRLARDMHDLTGQSLSLITLKSELAAKRLAKLPPAPERDAVLTELGDIGRVSRQTLHDIREAVSGYRRPTLAIEVITARNALDAAGIRLDDDAALTLRSGAYDPDAEGVLAWCLREAVTNVIRHSGATTCWIQLIDDGAELSLTVTDDGRGVSGPEDPGSTASTSPAGSPSSAGTGLRGISERLAAASGRLSLGPAGPGRPGQPRGFRLVATLPAAAALAVAGDNCLL